MSRVLVLEWSLSGQAREVTDTFLAPLTEAGHDVQRVRLEVDVEYPFPWTPIQFFGQFPETVLERPPAAGQIPLPDEAFDLIIASGSIWYLRPCMPWQAFLAGPQASWLSGRRVLTLTTCRNMWVTGWRRWISLLQQHGANVTDAITVTHSGPVFASFFSTLAWSVTGDRQAVKALPKVEVNAETHARVRGHGEVLAKRLHEGIEGELLRGEDTMPVSVAHAFGEMVVGANVFPILATVYAALSSPGTVMRAGFALFQMAFTIGMVVTLVLPFLAIHALFGRWIEPWVRERARLPV